jgi:8-oxo-dGTP pyrophosphatase MutT (NUDIX family)
MLNTGAEHGAHAQLVATLDAASNLLAGPEPLSTLEAMRALAEDGPDALVRTHRPGHFTGSALVVNPNGTLAVMFHRKLRRWLQPGGHADGVGDLAAVALREAAEETGLIGLEVLGGPVDVDIHEVRPPSEDPHLHYDVRFVVLATEDLTLRPNDESMAMRWVRPEELPSLGADESLLRLTANGFRRWIEQLN